MIQSAIGWLVSFLLGDVLGPGLVIAVLLLLAVILAVRGWRTMAGLTLLAALSLGSFLVGTQMEKSLCEQRILKFEKQISDAEDAERERQDRANEEIRRLRNDNFRLTVKEAETRRIKNEPIIKEIVRTQTIEKCSSAQWSTRELNRVRDTLRSRRERSGSGD